MNRIKEVLQTKNIDEVRPSKDLLDLLGIGVHSWNKWVEKKKDPELWQLEIVASFLSCNLSDLVQANERAGV